MNEKKLSRLNRLVTMFIDYAELMAEDDEYEQFRLKQDKEYISELDRKIKKYLKEE